MTSTLTDLAPDPDASPESMVVRVSSGERIHYLDWGAPREHHPADGPSSGPPEPGPVVVLVHGIAATGWSWAPVARRLTRVARVLALDLRGHGLSEGARGALDLSSLAWDVLTVVAANGAGTEVGGRPAILAGHGLGAMVVAEAARLQPASVAGLVLVDGGWEDIGAATRMSAEELSAALAEPPEVLASMDAFLEDRRDFDPMTWDEDQDRAARAQVERKHAGHVALITRAATLRTLAGTMLAYEPRETLSAVVAPVTILVAGAGTADDEAAHDRAVALREVVAAREAAEVPGTAVTPGTAGTPGTARTPDTAGTPGTARTPDTAGTPGTAATPGTPETPGTREAPSTRVVPLPGTGHNLMRYRPDAVALEIARLLPTRGR